MLQPIILAAGKGTRMKSELPKALQLVGGTPMLKRILDTLAGVPRLRTPIVVVGHGAEVVQHTIGSGPTYVLQTDINGTASAVGACVPHLTDGDGALVLYCDHPLITKATIERLRDTYEKSNTVLIQSVVQLPDFEDWRALFMRWGRIVRASDGALLRIVEYKNATDDEKKITEVNPAMYCIEVAWLKGALPRIKQNPVSGEYYLTDIVELAKADGHKIPTVEVAPEEAIGVNSKEEMLLMQRLRAERV